MVPFADRIGHIGTLGLYTFFKPYMAPGHDPDFVYFDARAGSLIEFFFFLICSILHLICPLLSVSKGGESYLLFL